jgi:hypothetical protein
MAASARSCFYTQVNAISRHIGQEAAAGLKDAFSLSTADAIQSLLTEAGFQRSEMAWK